MNSPPTDRSDPQATSSSTTFVVLKGRPRFPWVYRVALERNTLPVLELPVAHEGLRIAHLSDIHVDPFTGLDIVERAVTAVAALEPDLVALTGDFITSRVEAIVDLAPLLGRLRPPLGVFASFGNHDARHHPRRIRRALEAHGVTVLVNEGVAIDVRGEPLYIAGLDSGWFGATDVKRALAAHPVGAPAITLVHEPDLIDGPAYDDRVVLQLSGHSHGGQIRLPGIGAPLLPRLGRRYVRGVHRVGTTWLYTSRGLGMVGLPLRFRCPAEVAEITLVRADDAGCVGTTP
jgi:predicted MPP superfamily phosphohydrolase